MDSISILRLDFNHLGMMKHLMSDGNNMHELKGFILGKSQAVLCHLRVLENTAMSLLHPRDSRVGAATN